MFAYLHHFDPVIFEIWDFVKLRWYGLAYLMGFLVGYYLLVRLSRQQLWVIEEKNIGDFISMLAMFGVFLGGRLGYVFFYMIPEAGWELLREDPLVMIRVWEGGMASHGGFLGVALFTLWYAKRHQLSWTGIGDGICVVAPLGLMFGRIANFINGELYGRVTSHVPWSVQFAQALDKEPLEVQQKILDACAERAPEWLVQVQTGEGLALAARNSSVVHQICEEYLTPRHPSQCYEGLLEGALLFVLMWVLRHRYPKAPHGMICGIFFILYGVFRTFVEQYREPDAERILSLTKGQFYSLFMVIAGIAFLWHAYRTARKQATA
ncbi:MAG: prolipoprotein diacylglyceryl transferase [Verrucomicrobia bacterium]|nr:MAG: prolipoprotein diacylglyceryl transferase [Verrucomicrobiota bacterium]